MRILFFGDSITHGFFDLQGGWVARLSSYYHTQSVNGQNISGEWIECINLGVSGDTVHGVLTRFEQEYNSRQIHRDKNIVVIAIGINDTASIQGQPVNTLQNYLQEMKMLIDRVKAHTDKVLVVGMTIVEERRSIPEGGHAYSNTTIWEFEQGLRSLCENEDIPMVKIFEVMSEWQKVRSTLTDGLHPNDVGHKVIAERVKLELDRLINAH